MLMQSKVSMQVKAANELFSEKEEILANTKVMMEMVCETDSLDRDLQDSITELNVISEQMQIAIVENSRVALDQAEYEKHYAELTARYEKAKAKDDIRFIFKNGFEVRV